MRDNETISKTYKKQCLEGHEHEIWVTYETATGEFAISKEIPATKEEIAEEERKIKDFLKENPCYFCDKEVEFNLPHIETMTTAENYLAGFYHETHNPTDPEKNPICKSCWTEKKERIEHKNEYYTSLEDYWITIGIKGDEELKNCPKLPNYPKKGWIGFDQEGNIKESPVFFNEFDLHQITKFKEEVDIKGFQERKKTYGEISDEQKLFVLEHLCWLRDQELREGKKYEKFQEVIETIREIYRKQAEEK